MTMTSSTSEIQVSGDLQETLRLAILAILAAYAACGTRIEPAQLAEVKRRIADGSSRLGLFVSSDGLQVHAELALIKADSQSVFTGALLTLDGSPLVAMASPGTVAVVDRGAMN